MDKAEKSAYAFMNQPRNKKERLESLLQHDIIQAVEDGFNGHDVRRDVILKDVNWLIEQVANKEKQLLEAYHSGYKQGRFDEGADSLNQMPEEFDTNAFTVSEAYTHIVEMEKERQEMYEQSKRRIEESRKRIEEKTKRFEEKRKEREKYFRF
jgi:hypothetical protein